MHLIRRSALARRVALCLALVVAAVTSLGDEANDAATPPAYPDAEHVPNGCHLSALAYLARFKAAHPHESGETLILTLKNKDGLFRPHTIALVSWRGEWWGRDEYFGVFRLGVELRRKAAPAALLHRATTAFVRHGARFAHVAGYRRPPVRVGTMAAEELARAESAALRVLPVAGTLYRATLNDREFPLIFFRPDDRSVGVYDPHRGTCLAETETTDDLAVVAAIAERLGYRGDTVRADFPTVTAVVALAR